MAQGNVTGAGPTLLYMSQLKPEISSSILNTKSQKSNKQINSTFHSQRKILRIVREHEKMMSNNRKTQNSQQKKKNLREENNRNFLEDFLCKKS